MAIIPFYGTKHPELFALERSAMDRRGLVIRELDRLLPDQGSVLDIGAGDGFTARRLATSRRRVVALEPAWEMIDPRGELTWIQGEAERLPLKPSTMDAAYATWAYFFPSFHDIGPGLDELRRVVAPGGAIVLVNNVGEDEFTALAGSDIAEPAEAFRDLGFEYRLVRTSFDFESLDDARKLLSFYFGDPGRQVDKTSLSFNVGIFHCSVGG